MTDLNNTHDANQSPSFGGVRGGHPTHDANQSPSFGGVRGGLRGGLNGGFLRGIAILGIILHNYCHFLSFAVKENEYTFDADRPVQFWDKLMALDPDLFIHLFSFLGHYGVPVFLFVSGYGLVRKYEQSGMCGPRTLPFMAVHYMKLLRLMIIGYLVFIAVYILRSGDGATVYSFDRVAAQLTMVVNFCYERPDHVIKPGPYWFFGLMLQLYALYILLFHRFRRWQVVVAAIAVCWLLQVLNTGWESLNYMRYNFIGGVLPFGVGILYARHGKALSPRAYLFIIIVSAVAVLAGSLWFATWLWVPLFVVTGAVATSALLPAPLLRPFVWLGGLSPALFVMHPVMREVVIPHYRRIDMYFGIGIYLLSAVALAMLLRYVLQYVPVWKGSHGLMKATDVRRTAEEPVRKSAPAAPPHGIEMAGISRYRGELMGAAMLFVILFHVSMPRDNVMFALHRCGNVGVDIFLFLSGIGLWYSWVKTPSLRHFFLRRYLRVYPAWLVAACLFYIPNYLSPGGGYSPGFGHLIANIAFGWSFWRIDDLTFWYVPAIMMMYTFAPLYMMLIRRCGAFRWMPVAFMVWAVMVHYYPPVHAAVGHVEIFWSRIPIFLIGINCGQWVRGRRVAEPCAWWLVAVVFAASLLMCMEFEQSWRGRFPLFLERMVYIPLTVTTVLLLVRLLGRAPAWINRALAFIGGLSLEVYLLHVEFVMRPVAQYRLGYAVTAVITIVVSVAMAWVLSKVLGLAVGMLYKNKKI